MASMNSLVVSWNFDILTGSDISGTFNVSDVSNNYYGLGISFATSSTNFLLKEDIKTNKKLQLDIIEGIDTIQTLEEDDNRIDYLHKPSSMQLILENSMYQVISDEMLNMFSTIDAYTFKFIEPYNKYKTQYNKLIQSRYDFFSKVVEKPNLEKYLEFYKWIDSSLSYMIDQLVPESTNNIRGLKNTVESHILERNKFQHKLPLIIEPNRNYNSNIIVTSQNSLKKTDIKNNISDSIENIVNIENKKDINFRKNYEVIQTAGKHLNNRGNKENKTIFATNFSSVDGLSDIKRDECGEYSVYNTLNNRAIKQKVILNYSSSLGNDIQGSNDTYVSGGVSYNTTNFRDNDFIQRNIPYTSSNYHNLNEVNYQNIPNPEIEFRHRTNLLIEVNKKYYEDSKDIVEPPIQQNIPVKQNLKLNSAFENIDIYSPYSAQIDQFSIRNLTNQGSVLQKQISGGFHPISDEETVYKKIAESEDKFTFNKFEKLDVIFPRTDLIGLAQVRTKSPSYEEEVGTLNTASILNIENLLLPSYSTRKLDYWSNNSFNNNSGKIRSFWKTSKEDRKRTNGYEADNLEGKYYPATLIPAGSMGSFNALGFPNRIQENLKNLKYFHERNYHNSLYSMDCNVNYTINGADSTYIILTCSNEIYGELAPYSHFNLFYLNNSGIEMADPPKIQPKCSFTHNVFIPHQDLNVIDIYNKYSSSLGIGEILKVLNKSYQTGLDCHIKPWYNNYEEFRANIKHKSQTHSIIPEFITSRYEEVIKKQFVELYKPKSVLISVSTGNDIQIKEKTIPITDYLVINGGERYDQIRKQDYKVDFKQFIDKKSNKIKFKLNGIKKILPYNGFYPQQKTVQIASIFNNEYMNDTGYVTDEERIKIQQGAAPGSRTNIVNNRTLATMQPLFMPGILFNTIKAGVAMPWQTYTTNIDIEEQDDRFTTDATIFEKIVPNILNITGSVVKDLNRKFPFETILDPYKYFSSILLTDKYNTPAQSFASFDIVDLTSSAPRILPYLDPTHHCRDINISTEHVTDPYTRKLNIITLLEYMKKTDGRLYKSSINNFLAGTIDFFLSNTELTNIKSEQLDTVLVQSGKSYSMDIILKRNSNFSMFNKYSNENYSLIPSASLFGPPVNNASEGASLISDPLCYQPYAPPYFYNDLVRLTLSYEATSTKEITLRELVSNLTASYSLSLSDPNATRNKLNVKDLINYDLISGSIWLIQTKFETPLFNFNGCSLVQTGSVPYYMGS